MFVYSSLSRASAAALENYTTSATPNTPIDMFFIKSGTGRAAGVQRLQVQGKGAGLTSLSGIVYRLEKYPTTSAAGGSSVVPAPSDIGAQAAKATAAYATTAGGNVTAGTGTLVFMCMCGSSASGPGGWVAANIDDNKVLEAAANMSLDLFVASGTASLNYETQVDHVE
jgi:hypothetical protein